MALVPVGLSQEK